MVFPDENDCAYAAGILDGEGTIQIYKRRPRKNKGKQGCNDATPRFECQVSVGMTDRKVIYWFKDNFKGSACMVKKKTKANKEMFKWGVSGDLAIKALKRILPNLKTKKLQALLVIEFYENLIVNKTWKGKIVPDHEVKKREKIYDMMRLLNSGYDPEIRGDYHD